MEKLGSFRVGSLVRAQREEGEEWEQATIKSFDASSGRLSLLFAGGFLTSLPMASVRFDAGEAAEGAARGADGGEGEENREEEEAYAHAVGPLPPVPSEAELSADPNMKYAFIAAHKEAGNSLFKAGRYEWAIRTYEAGVRGLVSCFPSWERLSWDYEARLPTGQSYSNASLCALKLSQFSRASALCALGMKCRPEGADLIKLLLRSGQAALGEGRAEEAYSLLRSAAEKDPNNRAVREELARAKRAADSAAKTREKQLFKSMDLNKTGLTSKREEASECPSDVAALPHYIHLDLSGTLHLACTCLHVTPPSQSFSLAHPSSPVYPPRPCLPKPKPYHRTLSPRACFTPPYHLIRFASDWRARSSRALTLCTPPRTRKRSARSPPCVRAPMGGRRCTRPTAQALRATTYGGWSRRPASSLSSSNFSHKATSRRR